MASASSSSSTASGKKDNHVPILKLSFEDLEKGVSHLICCFWNDFTADCVLLIVYVMLREWL